MVYRFVALMGVSTAITLARGFLIATVVSLQDYGVYSVVVAVGAYTSNLLGMGQIEGTKKTFPRAWMAGGRLKVCQASDKLVQLILLRTFPAAMAAAGILYFVRQQWMGMVILVAGVAFGTAMIGVYASTLRASGDLAKLGQSTFMRSLTALLLGVYGGYLLGWTGAVIGEFVAAILAALYARQCGRKLVNWSSQEGVEPSKGLLNPDDGYGGRWLLFAMLAVSIPVYLDRLFVASVLGGSSAGQYGFLMLFVTGAMALSGILVQKVGPDLVKAYQKGASLSSQWRTAIHWMLLHIALIVTGVGIAGVFLLYGPAHFLAERYQLTVDHIVATMLLATLQCSVVLDWLLLSRDKERSVFFAAMVYLIFVLALASWFTFMGNKASLSTLILAMATAKFFHILAQGFMSLSASDSTTRAGNTG